MGAFDEYGLQSLAPHPGLRTLLFPRAFVVPGTKTAPHIEAFALLNIYI